MAGCASRAVSRERGNWAPQPELPCCSDPCDAIRVTVLRVRAKLVTRALGRTSHRPSPPMQTPRGESQPTPDHHTTHRDMPGHSTASTLATNSEALCRAREDREATCSRCESCRCVRGSASPIRV